MRCVLLLALTMSVAGCKNGGGSSGLTLDDLGPTVAPTLCEKIYTCCNPEEIGSLPDLTFSNQEECEDAYAFFYQLFVSSLTSAEKAGRLRFDGEAAQACLDETTKATCEAFRTTEFDVSSCPGAFEPLVPQGADCAQSIECVGEAWCEGGGVSPTGTCQPLPVVGENCTARCTEGAFCPEKSAQCTDQLPAGSACDQADACQDGICEGLTDTTSGTCGAAPLGFCG